jgi:hypothetical protein
MMHRLASLSFVLALLAPDVHGQVVRGTAHEAESGRAIESGVITLLDGDGKTIRAVLTDSVGEFGLRAPAPGAYRLRFERLGFRPLTTDRFTLDEGETESKAIRAVAVSVSLERIVVTDRPRCKVLPEADTVTARVWSAVRGVLASAAAGEAGWYAYVTIERFERDYDYRRKLVTRERKWTQTGASTAPFVAISAGFLEKEGFVVRERDSVVFFAPEARTLIAEEFLRTHCFRVRDERTERGRIGLDIEPIPRRYVPDIKGTLWLDAATGELRRLDFVYVNLPEAVPSDRAEGWVEFRRLPRGAWIVDRWLLRLPLVGQPPPTSVYGSGVPVAGELPTERVTELIGTHEEGGRIVSLDKTPPRAAAAPVSTFAVQGFVKTAEGAPVPGARAFLSGTGHSSVTDREGRFGMPDVTAGKYRLSFTHPRFDTLGIVGPVIDLNVTAAAEHQLAMPTDDQIARSVCQAHQRDAGETPTLMYGYVREGSSPAVVPNASVTVAWRAPIARGPTVGVRNEGFKIESDATGYYFVCGVPREIPLTVRASRGTGRGVEQKLNPLESPVTRIDVPVGRGTP